jgi:hypothetical protein
VLDWGDASVSHPFFSLVVTFRFLQQRTGLAPDDPWFSRLGDAYLEPWGNAVRDALPLAIRVGTFVRAIAYIRQRAALSEKDRPQFDSDFAFVLRQAVTRTSG